jgi:hypothetical protein
MSPEDWIARQIDNDRRNNKTELSPLMKKAHEKAAEVLNNPEYVIQESDFASVYGREVVAADTNYVNRMEKEFKDTNSPEMVRMKKVADTFEAIVLMQSEMNEWLGSAKTLGTAGYDDIVNKADMLAEWFTPEDGSRVLALGVDVTFGTTSLDKKISSLRGEINSGKLGSIKYFRDERGDFMGTRNNVPRTVIGVSEPLVEELSGLWLHKKNKALATHPAQYLFVDQMYKQLTLMRDYAHKQGKNDAVLAYTQALGVVEPLWHSKQKYKSKEVQADKVAGAIRYRVEQYFKT